MKSKKNIKSIFIILVFLMISCFFINISFATNTATINVETANLRETPSSDSKILEQFNVNQEVEILETSGDWYKVKAKGIIGYIRQDLITLKEQTVETNTENNSAQEQQPTEQVQQEEPKEEPVKENVEENVQEQVQENKPEENNSVDENVNIESNQYKIVEDAKLKIIPSINSTDIKELKKDESVILIETINSWVCVQAEETKGWLRVNKLVKEEIKQEEPAQVEEKPQVEEKVEEEVQEQQPEQPQEQPQEQQNEQPQQPETQPVQPVEPQVIKTLFINSQSVNLRKEPNTTSEVITSVVLNTSVDVYEEANGWSKVKVNGQDGYISSALLSDKKQETSRSSETPRKQQEEKTEVKEQQSINQSNNVSQSNNGSSVVATAKKYIGCSYVYGGNGPSSFDCSGFTKYVYQQYGVNLSRTAAAQYSNGTAVSRSQLQPGDLIMFGSSASSIDHVGIYIGGGQIVHAANKKRGVTTDTINSGYYNNKYVGARRVF